MFTNNTAKLVSFHPEPEKLIMRIARVSNVKGQESDDVRLLRYLIKENHWSPFDLVSFIFEVNTTRDVGRHILRHQSIKAQEFSQRYADVNDLGEGQFREARMQHPTNRQAALPNACPEVKEFWDGAQKDVWELASRGYARALEMGIAKEVARALLPEGLTPTRMYFNGTVRSWLHFCSVRSGNAGAQKEVVDIADQIRHALEKEVPNVAEAFFQEGKYE